MSNKISSRLIIIAALSIIFSMAASVVVFYEAFKGEVYDSLEEYSRVITNQYDKYGIEDIINNIGVDNIRVSVIDVNGNVLHDSNADITAMDNHGDRPEVLEAFEKGSSKSVRDSKTLNQSLYYYAVRLSDSEVLRVGKLTDSVWHVFISLIPLILLIVVVIFAGCVIIAKHLVKSIIDPIRTTVSNLDNVDMRPEYNELVPLVETIRRQHEDIVKNATIRQDFTANVSHELKTPLTAISGYSELIESGITGREETIHFAKEIHRSSQRLLTLINDIIRLSELDTSNESVPFEEFDLYESAQVCVEMMSLQCEKAQVSMKLQGEQAYIVSNKGMVEEVIYNLCDNAVRYNRPQGQVNVKVYSEADQVVLQVEDTGIGISEEHLERIFERFYRVDKSRSKKSGGTGLGLAIVKHLVPKLNGEIQLESEVDKGTIVRVSFKQS